MPGPIASPRAPALNVRPVSAPAARASGHPLLWKAVEIRTAETQGSQGYLCWKKSMGKKETNHGRIRTSLENSGKETTYEQVEHYHVYTYV